MPGARRDVHERALGLLAVRARSRREMELRLRRAGFDPEEVDGEIERLEGAGLLDDAAFARMVAEHAVQGRHAGRRAVASALAAKGIASDVAAAAIEEATEGDDEAEHARALATARATRLRSLAPEAAFRRLTGFLVRRGHTPAVARRAAAEALGIDRGHLF